MHEKFFAIPGSSRGLSWIMIVNTALEFRKAMKGGHFPPDMPSVPRGIFMVEPADFFVSSETSLDNRYLETEQDADPDRALFQYEQLVELIRGTGVRVKSFPGNPATPDGVFPNNVFATVPGRLIIGRMLYPGRQEEARRMDIRAYFTARGYDTIDLSGEDCVAELTGPLILDRSRRIGFCGMSDRVDEAGLGVMHSAFGLKLTFQFDLMPEEYHTNVIMSILAGRACVIHAEAFVDEAVPAAIAEVYPDRTLFINKQEKDAFAGNCIALTDNDLFMSQAGADALRPESRAALESWGFVLHSTELDEIEKAGGSLRCMLAEIF
jgi:hypothetical protein